MRQKGVTYWLEKNVDASLSDDTPYPDERRLMAAILQRALSDLDILVSIPSKYRKDAILWLEGTFPNENGISFQYLYEYFGLTNKHLLIIDDMIASAKELLERERLKKKIDAVTEVTTHYRELVLVA